MAIEIVEVLSMSKGTGVRIGIRHSLKSLTSHVTALAVSEAAYSSASVLDKAIVF